MVRTIILDDITEMIDQQRSDVSYIQRSLRESSAMTVSDGREGNEMAYNMPSRTGISQMSYHDNMKVIRVFNSAGDIIDNVRFDKPISVLSLLDSISYKIGYSSSLFCTKRGSIVVIGGELNTSADIQCKLCDPCRYLL